MSFNGFDLVQSVSLFQFVSADDSSFLSHRNEAADAGTEDSAEDVTMPPPVDWIELNQNADTDNAEAAFESTIMEADEDGWEGLTIVSSAPSQLTSSFMSAPAAVSSSEMLAASPIVHQTASVTHPLFSQVPLSISTTESLYADPTTTLRSLSSPPASLSRSMSLPSSLADLSLRSATFSAPSVTSANLSMDASSGVHNTNASTLSMSAAATAPLPQQLIRYRPDPASEQAGKDMWYAHFSSEQEWEQFQKHALELLAALDEPSENPEELLAKLIQQEEALFWEDPSYRNDLLRKRYYHRGAVLLGEVAIVLATAAFASFGLAGLARLSRQVKK